MMQAHDGRIYDTEVKFNCRQCRQDMRNGREGKHKRWAGDERDDREPAEDRTKDVKKTGSLHQDFLSFS